MPFKLRSNPMERNFGISPVKKATRKVCLPKAKIARMSSEEKRKVINAKKAAADKGKQVRSSKVL